MTGKSCISDDRSIVLSNCESLSPADTSHQLSSDTSANTNVNLTKSSTCCFILSDSSRCWRNKSFVSNFLTSMIMIAGIVLDEVYKSDDTMLKWSMVFKLIRAFGLFGFAGGLTNWLAVRMMFHRIPFLMGSGVLVNNFVEIIENVRRTTMETYFDAGHLSQYVSQKTEILLNSIQMDENIRKVIRSPTVHIMINDKIEEFFASAEGLVLGLVVDKNKVKDSVMPFIENLGSQMFPLISQFVTNSEHLSEDKLRHQINKLITSKITEMKPDDVISVVKVLVERELGWLVVWGNLIGGLLGTALELVAVLKG